MKGIYISSFKIDVSAENFQLLLDTSFWPPGAFVREFEHKQQKPAVHSSIPSEEVEIPHADIIEFKCIRICVNSGYTYLTLSYIPSQSDLSVYMQHAYLIKKCFFIC